MNLVRRSFIIGATASLIAAPALVRASSLMKIRGVVMPEYVLIKLIASRYSGETAEAALNCLPYSEKILGETGRLVRSATIMADRKWLKDELYRSILMSDAVDLMPNCSEFGFQVDTDPGWRELAVTHGIGWENQVLLAQEITNQPYKGILTRRFDQS